ncbi:Ig-like domain-containing protein [Leifsonia sp. 71-9]|uniref:Ig-like domain-containing protein n=1 Tax=Leifsonia sp. 71-9 TaxID=1895934 RepID=UPI000A8AF856|nr:Ig-like domain-containing protein [Leifsonia sp. 71-9]
MNNTFKKRAGRAAVAGATLLGLTAAGFAFAAPAGAATYVPSGPQLSGPLVNPTDYRALNANGITYTKYMTKEAVESALAAGDVAIWEYPAAGSTGPMISPNGKCLAGTTANDTTTRLSACNDTVIDQQWNGYEYNGVNFRMSRNTSYLLHYTNKASPQVVTYQAMNQNSNFGVSAGWATPAVTEPTLTSPLPNSEITPGTVFTGQAKQNTVITILDKDGKPLGTTEVGADKTWSLTLDPAPINGTVALKVVALDTEGKSTTLADGNYTMTQSDEARAYTGPTSGAITPDTVFTGTGAKGETVVIKDGAGTVLGTTTVGDDGHWSTTLNPVPTNGDVNLVVEITGADGIAEQLADTSLVMTGSEEPNAYTGPKTGDTVTPDTVFTGTGTKGETVTITDGKGNVLGQTEIGADGSWSLTLDPAPINGNHNLTVTIGDETVANPSITMTGSDEAPAYSGPAEGETVTPDTVFTGTGAKGETVVIKDGNGNILGEGVVGNDGQWSLTLDPAPKNGDVNLIIEVGGNKVADTNVVMEGSEDARSLKTPGVDGTITPDTVFSGNGVEGDTVVIKDSTGKVLGSVEVGADGSWSTTLSPAPANGDTDLTIEIVTKDGDTIQLADNTYEMTESTTKFEVLTPNLTESTDVKNGDVFAGKGAPGTTVVITDKDGTTIGSAEVDADGNWSTPIDGLPQGPNSLGITYTVPGADPISTDLGAIVVVSDDESTPLMDPAIAGGAGLALLAAAGSFLLIRRRRTTSTN